MYPTSYKRPAHVAEAVSLLADDDAKVLSGGQTLLPTMKQRLAAPTALVDVTRIPGLKGVTVAGGTVTVGAATTHYEVSTSAEVQGAIPALSALAAGIGDPQVRHLGTLGGSVANNDPAADYPAAVLALDATVVTSGREIAADDFFAGMFSTALEADEIITSIRFRVPVKAAYAKFPNPASRYAMAGVFVAKFADGSVRVAVTGAGNDGVFRLPALEAALAANWSADSANNIAVEEGDMLSDLHGDSAYRANLVKVMARRAIAAAG